MWVVWIFTCYDFYAFMVKYSAIYHAREVIKECDIKKQTASVHYTEVFTVTSSLSPFLQLLPHQIG
jgi:hypothetical protein